jgi:hypothetical protein
VVVKKNVIAPAIAGLGNLRSPDPFCFAKRGDDGVAVYFAKRGDDGVAVYVAKRGDDGVAVYVAKRGDDGVRVHLIIFTKGLVFVGFLGQFEIILQYKKERKVKSSSHS